MKLFLVCLILVSWSCDLFVRGGRPYRRPIKTIKTSHGDIFDCVDIYKQPAFDHPLLKDHKILTRPKVRFTEFARVEEEEEEANGNHHNINLELEDGGCPEGTVPIHRVPENNLTAAAKVPQDGYHPDRRDGENYVGMFATRRTMPLKFYGASSNINVYGVNPVGLKQRSGAMIWLMNHDAPDILKPPLIQAGWIVDPTSYGDLETRLTIAWNWVFDGCINLQCPGFVQTSRKIGLGSMIRPLSTPGGTQYYVHLHMYMDESKNWWFAFRELSNTIGYWPQKIFTPTTGTFDHASEAQFGGLVGCLRGEVCPAMGSGVKPDSPMSAFMRRVQVIGSDHKWGGLGKLSSCPWVTHKRFYNIGDYQHKSHEYKFHFGGPPCPNTAALEPYDLFFKIPIIRCAID